MTNPERYRYRIQFEKRDEIRFIGHLDLQRTWERTLRRASLPLCHSQGFNPRPKINLGRALPLGQTSECELIEIWLEQEIEPDELLQRLKAAAPPGLMVVSANQVPLSEASLQSRISSASYLVTLDGELDRDHLQSSVERLLQSETLPRVRRKKEYDLRPLIESISIASSSPEAAKLLMQLAAREGASGRPEEVLLEIGLEPAHARTHRIKLFFEDDL
ncbi:MAG: TIGR03936 family radical SAM-associated protein [Anaerolineales bacterium]|nr:TIGR03936 family radical SAM-associated protein [Anaerolineales bacterium]